MSNSFRFQRRALALVLALTCTAAHGQDDSADLTTAPADAPTTASGITWKLLTPGTGKRQAANDDVVAVHFNGYSPTGELLFGSYDLGKPLIIGVWAAFPGWQETLMQMVSGEKRRIWLPENMVARERGPVGASIFDLELVAIRNKLNTPENLTEPPADAQRTPSGALTQRISAGAGEEFPGPDSTVLLDYSGWTKDGKMFDSSHARGRPTAFPLGQIMPAFAEAVQLMVVGEKRRIWIPGPVAAGNWVGSPKGALVFDVSLLQILPDDALERVEQATPQASSGAGSS